jgi:pilus assembly protein TadC
VPYAAAVNTAATCRGLPRKYFHRRVHCCIHPMASVEADVPGAHRDVPVVAASGVLGLGWLEPMSARRRREQLIMEVPQALELMAACLAAGLPARTACAAVVRTFDGPVADDLGQVMALLELGVGDVVAWQALHDHPHLGLAAADLARSVESGTSMVQGLRHHAAAAREVRRSELQVLARAVGVRSVIPLMMCFIPSFLLLGIAPAVVSAVFNALP